MKLTTVLQKTAAGMIAFVLVIMAAVLTIGATMPAWAVENDVQAVVIYNGNETSFDTLKGAADYVKTLGGNATIKMMKNFYFMNEQDLWHKIVEIALVENFTFDLNGYILDLSKMSTVEFENVTVIDSNPQAEHLYTEDANGLYIIDDDLDRNNPDVKILRGGVVTNCCDFIRVCGSSVINGGNFVGNGCGLAIWGDLMINDVIIKGNYSEEYAKYYEAIPALADDGGEHHIVINGGNFNGNIITSVRKPSYFTFNGGNLQGKFCMYDYDSYSDEDFFYELTQTEIDYLITDGIFTFGANTEPVYDPEDATKIIGYREKVVTAPEPGEPGEPQEPGAPEITEPGNPTITPENPGAGVPNNDNDNNDKPFPWVPVAIGAGVIGVALLAAIGAACLAGRRK